jgi:hypothetical protein
MYESLLLQSKAVCIIAAGTGAGRLSRNRESHRDSRPRITVRCRWRSHVSCCRRMTISNVYNSVYSSLSFAVSTRLIATTLMMMMTLRNQLTFLANHNLGVPYPLLSLIGSWRQDDSVNCKLVYVSKQLQRRGQNLIHWYITILNYSKIDLYE